MDGFLILLLIIVLTPLIIREWRAVVISLSKHGGTLLDYLDAASAPLGVRALLRWIVGPLDWLAKQLGKDQTVSALLDMPEVDPETEEPEGESKP